MCSFHSGIDVDSKFFPHWTIVSATAVVHGTCEFVGASWTHLSFHQQQLFRPRSKKLSAFCENIVINLIILAIVDFFPRRGASSLFRGAHRCRNSIFLCSTFVVSTHKTLPHDPQEKTSEIAARLLFLSCLSDGFLADLFQGGGGGESNLRLFYQTSSVDGTEEKRRQKWLEFLTAGRLRCETREEESLEWEMSCRLRLLCLPVEECWKWMDTS